MEQHEYCFDAFLVQPTERRLIANGAPLEVSPRAFDLLLLLLDNPGQLRTKSELLDKVWRGVVVEEANLHVQVSALRKLLGPGAIETVKRQGYRFNADVAVRRVSPSHALPRVTNLPRRLTSFVGREVELGELARALDETRLLTLHGLGGSGKTRLAIRLGEVVAPAHPGGVWFADLTAASDRKAIAQTVADAVGVRFATGQRTEHALADRLAGLSAMLVLDNCDHALEASAAFAQHLLEAAYDLQIVATSRSALGLPGEHRFHVQPLSLHGTARSGVPMSRSDAAALFVERARAVAPPVREHDLDPALVDAICARLDGMPLSIELAAARLAVLSLQQLHELLPPPARAGDDRQVAPPPLQDVIAWSFTQLAPASQMLARRCSVFAGGFDLAAATAVSGPTLTPAMIADSLQDLLAGSLIQVTHAADTAPRFTMLETVRQEMQRALRSADDAAEVERLHFFHYLRLAESTEAAFVEGERDYVRTLDPERDNLIRAHRWCDRDERSHPLGLQLANAMRRYWVDRQFVLDMPPLDFDPIAQGYRIMCEALARSGAQDRDTARSRALAGAGQFARYVGRIAEALAYNDESIAIARDMGDDARLCMRLTVRAWFHSSFGDVALAAQMGDEAMALAIKVGSPALLANVTLLQAAGRHLAGDFAGAHEHARCALDIVQSRHLLPLDALYACASSAWADGDLAAAIHFLHALIDHDAIGRDRRTVVDALALCALVAHARHDDLVVARLGSACMEAAQALPQDLPHTEYGRNVGQVGKILEAQFGDALAAQRHDAALTPLPAMIAEGRAWVTGLLPLYPRATEDAALP